MDLQAEGAGARDGLSLPQPSRRAWLAAFTGALAVFAIWGNFFSYGVILVPLLCQFQSGRAITSLVGSLGYGLSVAGGPLGMQLVDRFGAPRVLTASLFLTAIGTFLSSLPNSIYPLFITYALVVGVGGFGYICVTAEVPCYFPQDQQARVIAFVEDGTVAGMLVLAPLLNVLINWLGWRHALWAFSGLLFVLMLPAPFFFANRKKEENQQRISSSRTGTDGDNMQLIVNSENSCKDSLDNGGSVQAEEEAESSFISPSGSDEESTVEQLPNGLKKSRLPDSLKPYKELGNRQYLLLMVTATLFYYGFTTPVLFVIDESTKLRRNDSNDDSFPTDMSSPRCKPKITDALLYTYISLVMLVMFPLAGWLFDRLPTLRQRVLLVQTFYIIGAVAVLFLAICNTEHWHFVVFAIIFGVARTPDCLHQALVLQLVGERLYPYGWALMCFVSGMADALSPSITGLLADKTGSFTIGFVVIAAVFLVATILITFLPKLNSERSLCCSEMQRPRERYKRLKQSTSNRSPNGLLISNLAESL